MGEQSQQHLGNAARGNKLVCLALLLGQAIYAGIILALMSFDSLDFKAPISDPGTGEMFVTLGVVAAAVALPVALVVRMIIWRRARGGSDSTLFHAFALGNIAFQVVLEGAGLLNLTLWLATGASLPYTPIFAALFIIGVLALFRSHTSTR